MTAQDLGYRILPQSSDVRSLQERIPMAFKLAFPIDVYVRYARHCLRDTEGGSRQQPVEFGSQLQNTVGLTARHVMVLHY